MPRRALHPAPEGGDWLGREAGLGILMTGHTHA